MIEFMGLPLIELLKYWNGGIIDPSSPHSFQFPIPSYYLNPRSTPSQKSVPMYALAAKTTGRQLPIPI